MKPTYFFSLWILLGCVLLIPIYTLKKIFGKFIFQAWKCHKIQKKFLGKFLPIKLRLKKFPNYLFVVWPILCFLRPRPLFFINSRAMEENSWKLQKHFEVKKKIFKEISEKFFLLFYQNYPKKWWKKNEKQEKEE